MRPVCVSYRTPDTGSRVKTRGLREKAFVAISYMSQSFTQNTGQTGYLPPRACISEGRDLVYIEKPYEGTSCLKGQIQGEKHWRNKCITELHRPTKKSLKYNTPQIAVSWHCTMMLLEMLSSITTRDDIRPIKVITWRRPYQNHVKKAFRPDKNIPWDDENNRFYVIKKAYRKTKWITKTSNPSKNTPHPKKRHKNIKSIKKTAFITKKSLIKIKNLYVTVPFSMFSEVRFIRKSLQTLRMRTNIGLLA